MIFFLLAIFWSFSSTAKDVYCNPVNLLLKKKWGRADLAVLKKQRWAGMRRSEQMSDQGRVRTCFAFASVGIVDFWREDRSPFPMGKIATNSALYAVLLANIYESHEENKNPFQGGLLEESLLGMKKYGMCKSEIIYNAIESFSKKYPQISKVFPHRELLLDYISTLMSLNIFKKKLEEQGEKAYRTLVIEELSDFFIYYQDKINLGIDQDEGFKEQLVLSYQLLKQTGSFLRALLDKGIPTAIGLCSNLFKKKSYVGTKVVSLPDRGIHVREVIIEKKCHRHASIIVGKKMVDGSCHYLIKNSHGDDCDYSWPCRFNEKGQAMGVYIAEEAILPNILLLTYLGKKSDLYCQAKTSLGSEFFGMDYPSHILKWNQEWRLFEGALFIKLKAYLSGNKTWVRILQEQDKQEVFIDEILFEKKKRRDLFLRSRALNVGKFSLKCIKRGDFSEATLKKLLKEKKIAQKPILCTAEGEGTRESLQLDYPTDKDSPRQYRVIFKPNQHLLFSYSGKRLSIHLGVKSSYTLLDRFSYTQAMFESYKKRFEDFTLRCGKNPNYHGLR
jgi:hypothetical protein